VGRGAPLGPLRLTCGPGGRSPTRRSSGRRGGHP
jgi:hypothetical protein